MTVIKKIDEIEISEFRVELKILCSMVRRFKFAKNITKNESISEFRLQIRAFIDEFIKKQLNSFTKCQESKINYVANVETLVEYCEVNFKKDIQLTGSSKIRNQSSDERIDNYRKSIKKLGMQLGQFQKKTGQLNVILMASVLLAIVKINNLTDYQKEIDNLLN